MDFCDQKGEQENERELINLVGLYLHGKAGNIQPVQIARVMVCAQWGEQQEDKQNAGPKHQLPVFLHEQLKVDEGTQDIDDDSQKNRYGLDDNSPVVPVVPGGGIDQRHAIGAGQQTQEQKELVPFFPELLKGGEQGIHRFTSGQMEYGPIFYHFFVERGRVSVL